MSTDNKTTITLELTEREARFIKILVGRSSGAVADYLDLPTETPYDIWDALDAIGVRGIDHDVTLDINIGELE